MSRSRPSPDEPAAGSALGHRTRDPLAAIAYLLGPAGGNARYVRADDGWTLPAPPAGTTVVWGRPALASGTPRATAIRGALARERRLRAARRRPGVSVRRLPPQRLSGGGFRNAIRDALLGGAVVILPAEPGERRVLDDAAAGAGVEGPLGRIHLSSGGSIVARVRTRGGDAVLRVGVADAPGDPSRGAAALAHLSAIDGPIPRLLATGRAGDAAWALESALPGGRPQRLTRELAANVAAVCAAFPSGNGPPGAPRRDLDALAALIPDREEALLALAREIRTELRTLTSILRHGDLWLGNLLVDGGGLSGIVDWDAWDPGSVPGADLLHLHATARRIEERCQLGEIWSRRPWREESFRATLRGPATEVPEDILAIAWWAGEVRGTVSRHPARATDEAWLAVNVDGVLRSLRS